MDRNSPTVCLKKIKKKSKMTVARLLYIAFKGQVTKNDVIIHLDGDKTNNELSNLKKTNKSMAAKYRNWLKHEKPFNPDAKFDFHFRPKHDGNPKLTDDEVRMIRHKKSRKASIRALAEEFEVSRSTIENIIYNKTYKHLL